MDAGKSKIENEYVTATEAGALMGVTRNRVGRLCIEGRFNGAIKMGGIWLIPREAVLSHKRLPPGVKGRAARREEDAALLSAVLAEAKEA